MRIYRYTVYITPTLMGDPYSYEDFVQVEPDTWSDEHIRKMILEKLFEPDMDIILTKLEQIPILG